MLYRFVLKSIHVILVYRPIILVILYQVLIVYVPQKSAHIEQL